MNVYHTWVKHRGEVIEIEKVEPKNFYNIFATFFNGTEKTRQTTIIFIIFWDFLMFYENFLSPQVKQCVIITYKHCIYESPHVFLNDVRLRIWEN